VPESADQSLTTGALGAPINVAYFLVVWVAAAIAQTIVLVAFGVRGDPSIGVLLLALPTGWAVFLVGTVIASRQGGSGSPRKDFAISARLLDLVGVPIGAAAQLMLVPAVYVPLRALWPDTFSDEALSETAQDLVDRARNTSDAMLILLVGAVVIGAPLVEEIVYRGLLQRPLLGRFNRVAVLQLAVVVGVALTFALIHFRPVEYPGLFAAGLVFGICAWRSGRLGMSIAAHIGFNAVGIAMAL
jgi:uncharacterized protein